MNIVSMQSQKSPAEIEYDLIIGEMSLAYEMLKNAETDFDVSKSTAMIKYLQWRYETIVEY